MARNILRSYRSPKQSENLLAILLQQESFADSIYQDKRSPKHLILKLSRYKRCQQIH